MGDYLQRLGDNTLHRLDELRSNIIQGFEEFSKNLGKYTANSVKDLIRNYWDVGAALLSAYALTDTDSKVFGDNRFPLALVSGLASMLGAHGSIKNWRNALRENPLSEESMDRAINDAQAGIEPKYTDIDRLARNGYAFLAAFSYWSQRGLPNVPEANVLISKLTGLGLGGMSILHDHFSRERRNEENSEPQHPSLPLENLLE